MEAADNSKQNIMDWLKSLETKHGFKLIHVAETGAYGRGMMTNNSDFDLKGFFIFPK